MPVPRYLLIPVLLMLYCAHISAEGRLQIAVSIIPQQILVERIGRQHVEVQLMVQPGHSPATYEPGPRQMAGLSQADLYYRIGAPFERAWMGRILDAYPGLPVLDARDGVKLRQMEDVGHGEHGHEHMEGEPDPHIWLSLPLVKGMTQRLRDRLIELDPVHRVDYQNNHARLQETLGQLDMDIRQILSTMRSRRFMVYHPSWGYFADAYGLRQVAIESEGKEPGAQTLARVLEAARGMEVSSVFVQKQFSQAQAKAVAEAIGARVVVIDSLSEKYPENLRAVARAMAEGP